MSSPEQAAGSSSGASWPRGLWWHPHPFSLSAEPLQFDTAGRGLLRITVRNLGKGSAQLARTEVPERRWQWRGPYGIFSTAARSRNKVVMIGAGIGITPLRALLESTPFTPGNATVILRGRSEQELYLGDEILELARRRGATLFHLTGARSARHPDSWLPDIATDAGHRLNGLRPRASRTRTFMSAGRRRGHGTCSADARAAGVNEDQLHYERFDW